MSLIRDPESSRVTLYVRKTLAKRPASAPEGSKSSTVAGSGVGDKRNGSMGKVGGNHKVDPSNLYTIVLVHL